MAFIQFSLLFADLPRKASMWSHSSNAINSWLVIPIAVASYALLYIPDLFILSKLVAGNIHRSYTYIHAHYAVIYVVVVATCLLLYLYLLSKCRANPTWLRPHYFYSMRAAKCNALPHK
jgi:hypothetical protein